MARGDRSRTHLRRRVERWSKRLKVQPRIVRVRRMTRKWGSCSTKGVVTLAEDLARQGEAFQDFVIAHELLHLRVRNHGRVFKAFLTLHIPNWRKHTLTGTEKGRVRSTTASGRTKHLAIANLQPGERR
jgi:predicted metal-dependent hydrolase